MVQEQLDLSTACIDIFRRGKLLFFPKEKSSEYSDSHWHLGNLQEQELPGS